MQMAASANTKVLARSRGMGDWCKEGEKAEPRTWTQRSRATPPTHPIHLFIQETFMEPSGNRHITPF